MGRELARHTAASAEETRTLQAAAARGVSGGRRLPLFQPYRRLLDRSIADLCNIANSRYGGAITAALYPREFVSHSRWIHIDTMDYNLSAQPGWPLGGQVPVVRALFRMLGERYR